jgi:hypothetical protein
VLTLIQLYIYRHVDTVIDQTRVDYCILVGKLTLVWYDARGTSPYKAGRSRALIYNCWLKEICPSTNAHTVIHTYSLTNVTVRTDEGGITCTGVGNAVTRKACAM